MCSAVLVFDTTDPVAVEVIFDTQEAPAWKVARSLLRDGCFEIVGDGDIQLEPHAVGNILIVKLSSSDGSAKVIFPLKRIAQFLEGTYRMVSAEREDALVAEAVELFSDTMSSPS